MFLVFRVLYLMFDFLLLLLFKYREYLVLFSPCSSICVVNLKYSMHVVRTLQFHQVLLFWQSTLNSFLYTFLFVFI